MENISGSIPPLVVLMARQGETLTKVEVSYGVNSASISWIYASGVILGIDALRPRSFPTKESWVIENPGVLKECQRFIKGSVSPTVATFRDGSLRLNDVVNDQSNSLCVKREPRSKNLKGISLQMEWKPKEQNLSAHFGGIIPQEWVPASPWSEFFLHERERGLPLSYELEDFLQFMKSGGQTYALLTLNTQGVSFYASVGGAVARLDFPVEVEEEQGVTGIGVWVTPLEIEARKFRTLLQKGKSRSWGFEGYFLKFPILRLQAEKNGLSAAIIEPTAVDQPVDGLRQIIDGESSICWDCNIPVDQVIQTVAPDWAQSEVISLNPTKNALLVGLTPNLTLAMGSCRWWA